MSFAVENLRRLSTKLTKLIAINWGERFPFWYVCEYPKSGGTWLSQMVAGYLNLPFPQWSVTPIGFSCVIHNHWRYHRKLRRCFYLYRDGRDIMVSLYFFRMKSITKELHLPLHRELARRYQRRLGRNFDPQDTHRNLPAVIEMEMTVPRGARINWPAHVADWYDPARSNVAYVSYEELLREPVPALSRCFQQFLDQPIDESRLREVVNRFSFKAMTGRAPGSEDRSSFLRKGVASDWVNHFTREAAEVFDRFAGQTLIDLGYERDRSWIERLGAAPVEPALRS